MGRILARCWPALLAWYLGGSVVRAGVLALAAPIGPQSPLAALLLVPIAVLARLISYVGMFLAVRRALPSYRRISAGDVEFTSLRDASSEFIRVLIASILPFFALYTVIGQLAVDLADYARSSFKFSLGSENGVLRVGDGPLVVIVIVVAFAGRSALKALGPRLPRWLAIVEIYLEATWIFVALTGISAVFGPVIEWMSNRQVVHWVGDAREWLVSLANPIRIAIESVDWVVPVALQLIALPLAWLLIAGVIYTRSLASAVEERLVSKKIEVRLRARMVRLPRIVSRRMHLFSDEWEDVGGPLAMAGRMIVRAGAVNIAIFVTAYGLLYAATQWIFRFAYTAIGAQDVGFWNVGSPVLNLVISAVTEPLRLVLVAAAFDWCLRRWADRRQPLAEGVEPLPQPDEVDRHTTGADRT